MSAERLSEPQAVAELLVEVLRVWVTRDEMKLTDAQIRERAANGALALITSFDVRHRDDRPGWRSIAAANAPDPRVNTESSEYGKRTVIAAFAVDSLGRLCRFDGDDPTPVILSPPPPVDAMATTVGEDS
jgi:hypothetical protein